MPLGPYHVFDYSNKRIRIECVIIYFIAGMKDNMRMHARYLDGVHDYVVPKMMREDAKRRWVVVEFRNNNYSAWAG